MAPGRGSAQVLLHFAAILRLAQWWARWLLYGIPVIAGLFLLVNTFSSDGDEGAVAVAGALAGFLLGIPSSSLLDPRHLHLHLFRGSAIWDAFLFSQNDTVRKILDHGHEFRGLYSAPAQAGFVDALLDEVRRDREAMSCVSIRPEQPGAGGR